MKIIWYEIKSCIRQIHSQNTIGFFAASVIAVVLLTLIAFLWVLRKIGVAYSTILAVDYIFTIILGCALWKSNTLGGLLTPDKIKYISIYPSKCQVILMGKCIKCIFASLIPVVLVQTFFSVAQILAGFPFGASIVSLFIIPLCDVAIQSIRTLALIENKYRFKNHFRSVTKFLIKLFSEFAFIYLCIIVINNTQVLHDVNLSLLEKIRVYHLLIALFVNSIILQSIYSSLKHLISKSVGTSSFIDISNTNNAVRCLRFQRKSVLYRMLVRIQRNKSIRQELVDKIGMCLLLPLAMCYLSKAINQNLLLDKKAVSIFIALSIVNELSSGLESITCIGYDGQLVKYYILSSMPVGRLLLKSSLCMCVFTFLPFAFSLCEIVIISHLSLREFVLLMLSSLAFLISSTAGTFFFNSYKTMYHNEMKMPNTYQSVIGNTIHSYMTILPIILYSFMSHYSQTSAPFNVSLISLLVCCFFEFSLCCMLFVKNGRGFYGEYSDCI